MSLAATLIFDIFFPSSSENSRNYMSNLCLKFHGPVTFCTIFLLICSVIVCVLVCVFGMVQYGDNQVATAPICVCICVSVCDGSIW